MSLKSLPKGFTVGDCNCGRKNAIIVDETGRCGRCTSEIGLTMLREVRAK